MKNINQWLHSHASTGDESLSKLQVQQTKARILLTIASFTYLALHGPYFGEYAIPATAFVIFYFITNAAALKHLRKQPFGTFGTLFYPIQDTAIVTFGMLLDGGHTSGIFFMLLPIIIGNGLRFGNRLMVYAQVLCVIGLLIITTCSHQFMNIPIDGTLLTWQLFTLLAVPYYVFLIGRKLEQAITEKTAVEESSFHLIDKGAVPVFTFELDEYNTPQVQYANDAIAALFQVRQGDVMGREAGLFALAEDTQEFNRYCTSILTEESPEHKEQSLYIRGMDHSGNILKLMVRAVRLRWHSRWIGVCFLVDITQRETLQEQLEAIHRQGYMSTMVAGIVHDFRNILTNMIGYAEVLQMGMSNEAEKKQIDEIIAAGERGSDLISHLLKLSRNIKLADSSTSIAGHAIREPIETIIGLARLQLPAKIKMNHKISEPLDDASISLIELEQILLNLINNAMQSIEGAGEVSIRIFSDAKHSLASNGKSPLCIQVSDTGTGIAEEDLDNIFKPFWSSRTTSGGSGLGLTMIQRIIKLHHGDIAVESKSAEGTTFTLHLPPSFSDNSQEESTATESKASSKDNAMLPHASRSNMRILVVDDAEDILLIHQALLERMGHTVITSPSGADALTRLAEADTPFDIIITDFRMPGMSGLELIREVRAQGKTMPILMVTAFGEDEHLSQVSNYKVCLINKPASFDRLKSGIAEAISISTKK